MQMGVKDIFLFTDFVDFLLAYTEKIKFKNWIKNMHRVFCF